MSSTDPTILHPLGREADGPLKVDDLDFYALFRRQADQGRLFFNQRRAVIFDTEALGTLRQQLIDTLGTELVMGVLTRFGYAHGSNDVKMLGENLDWETEADWLAAGPFMHTLEGIVHVTPEKIEFDRKTGDFHMCGIWLNSYEAEEHLKRYGPSDHPVCWTLTGYASGYTSGFFGRELLAIETECVGKGDDRCYWEIRPVEEWGVEAEPYLAALEQVDMSGELYKANQRLQEQTRQLTLLNQMSAKLGQAASVDEVFQIVAANADTIVSGSRASVALLTPEGDEFEVLALDGVKGAIPVGTRLPLAGTAIGKAVSDQQLINTADIATSEFADHRQLAQRGLRSTVNVPLIAGAHPIGTLNVGSDELNAYGPHDENVMLQLASVLASAVENRRLFEQTQERATALEETTGFLDSIVENIPTMVFVKEVEDLRFVRFNKAGEDLLGFGREDLLGKNDYDFFPKDEADFFTAKDREVLDGGQLVDIPEEPIQTAAGEVRLLHTRKVPVMGSDGKPKYLLGISEDITERKQAEEALKESQNIYQSSIDGLPQNVYRIDKEGRIVFGNKVYQETLGMTMEEFLGKTAYDFFPKELADKYTFDDQHVMQTEEVLDVVEAHKVPATGEMNYVRVVKTPVKDSLGSVTGVQATFWDVTQRIQTEQALTKRAAELATVAEVGTAVTTILDTTELLQTVVNLTKERFELYHAHIYLLNDTGDTLNLAAGAGTTGQQMVAEGWSISFSREQSLVTRAARAQQGIIVNDVREDPDYLQNPLLPDTRAELAVPLMVGNEVLGVLDIQADAVDHFTEDDVRVQAALAAQVAVALQNATQYEKIETALSQVQESQALTRTIVDNAEYAIISTSPEGIITSFNPAAERMLDYTAEELVGKESPAIFHKLEEVVERAGQFSEELGETIEPGFEVFAAKARRNLPNQYEWTYIRKDGTEFPVLLTISAIRGEAGEAIGFFGFAQDITGQKESEALLAKRATELEVVAQMGTAASTILDAAELLQTVVDLTKQRFGLYHAHIYLLNNAGNTLNLAAGAGDVGRQMVAKGWSIPLDREQSLVARAARAQQGVIVNDVREDPDYLPNPLLPDTRAELAVPMLVGNRVVGVLDVQAEDIDHFTAEDIRIQTTLASQITVALENARLLQQTQARAQREQILREISTRIRGSADVDTILRTTAQEVGRALDRPAFVYLGKNSNGEQAATKADEQSSIEE